MKTMMFVAIATITLLCNCSPKMSAIKNKTINHISTDNSGKPMLIGTWSEQALKKDPFNVWYDKNYTDYKVNDSIASAMTPLLSNKKFLLFMGTWCGDSRREVPRMFKILHSSGIKDSQVKMVMLDDHDSTYKQSPQHEERGLNIHRVPTLVVYENDSEIGRIVESPVVSLEKDLLNILSHKSYQPNYHAVTYMNEQFAKMTVNEIEINQLKFKEEIKPMVKNAGELNTYGYVLMYSKELEKALCIFKLNAMIFPENKNMYDSLGEYYFFTGDKNSSKEYYNKVLQLDPANANAKKMLEKLN